MATRSSESRSKIFNDPIHGHIEMHELCVKIIDTPQFQRLRNIKQLGGCYFVYPGAAHNRFEHSIGTSHLAGCLVESLQAKQKELDISKEDVLCVKIAGLCHDLGHGPFSHLFDKRFIPEVIGTDKDGNPRKWKHEQASEEMFQFLLEDNQLEKEFKAHDLDKTHIQFIKDLINVKNEKEGCPPGKKRFLYEIVSNEHNGIDVDKWDYFARDCHNLGMKNSFDHMRCIKMARVIEFEEKRHICFRDKEVGNIYEMFHTRSTLHRRAYQHKTCNAVEKMITEAFKAANDHIKVEFEQKGEKQEKEPTQPKRKELKMSETVDEMAAYTKLTDNVYYEILYSTKKELQKAKEILHRIEKRDLYRLIEERTFASEEENTDWEEDIIKKTNEGRDTDLVTKEDIFVDIVTFNYGKKDKNPVNSVYFYKKETPEEAFKFLKDEVSHMLPKVFSEKKIRLYSRKKLETEQKEKLKDAFKSLFKPKSPQEQEKSTPEEAVQGASSVAKKPEVETKQPDIELEKK